MVQDFVSYHVSFREVHTTVFRSIFLKEKPQAALSNIDKRIEFEERLEEHVDAISFTRL